MWPVSVNGMVPRVLASWAAMATGAWLGWLGGRAMGVASAGTALGAMAAMGLAMAVDDLRARHLMAWLREDMAREAPRLGGLWGEIAHRVDRSRRQQGQALANEQRRLGGFLSAIEASPNGVLLLDRGDHISWCNALAADHLGLNPLRDRGQPITNLVRSPVFVSHLQSGHWQEPVALAMPGRDGTVLVSVRGHGQGQKLLVTQDVTERQRGDAMRRDLVANVSHEIRSPLTVLSGFIETMQTLALGEAERQRMLSLMQQQSERMQGLVSDLLVLARLEGDPRPPIDHWVALADLMHRVADDARQISAGRHRIELIDGEPLSLAGSPAELLSAVTNLATNAVRYTPDGGLIRLSWSHRPDGQASIEVADTGIGVAREHLPRLTERFYRVDSSRSRETGGTGLGLAIVKHVVQRHGGVLEVDSVLGEGSRFRLVLPPCRVQCGAATFAVA